MRQPNALANRFTSRYEADVLEGLESFAADELVERFGEGLEQLEQPHAGTLSFAYHGNQRALFGLRSVLALYQVLFFDIARPKALLGHEHLTRLLQTINSTRALSPAAAFQSFRLSAAGEDSTVLTRLKEELAVHSGLAVAQAEGDLLLRLRRARGRPGWEMLVRTTPRPLATRSWRICNLPGALNATLAYAMMQLTEPAQDDTLLNIACGSGTLLIERLALAPTHSAIGCDTSPQALGCAQRNLAAAGYSARLERWDATQLPLPNASASVVCADLPFGQIMGSHRENERLYPALLAEAGRVAMPGARLVLLTHEVRLLEQVAAQLSTVWAHRATLPVHSGGMTPRIFAFERL